MTNRIKGLDTLRFISITFVILHHLLFFIPSFFKTTIHFDFATDLFGRLGLYGIHFFFAGSGFLITYLLQRELNKFGKIDLSKFYIRRILRIWPAYYLLIFISLIVLIRVPFFNIPGMTDSFIESNNGLAILMYFLFLPQLAPYFATTAPFVHPTYTLGIEEQFYFLWGLLYKFFKRRIRLIFIILLILSVLGNIYHDLVFKGVFTGKINSLLSKIAFYYQYSRIGCFALGSLLALEYLKHKHWLSYFKKAIVQILMYVIFCLLIFFDIRIPYIFQEQMALLTSLIFLCATNRESIINYNVKALVYLGKISYGIYLFHIYAIIVVCKVYRSLVNDTINTPLEIIILSVFSVMLAAFFGWVSYSTIERFFLRIKEKFRMV